MFHRNGMTFGFCGSFRMGQLLRFGLDPLEHPGKMDDFEFMATCFINDVRATLRLGGYSHIKDNEEIGGNFLVAYREGLYEIECDFQVGISTRDYVCIGSGSDVANGAMGILVGQEVAPVQAIKSALAIASKHDAYVAPPFVVKRHRP